MISPLPGPGKRGGEPFLTEEQPPSKKCKSEDKEENNLPIDHLPNECLETISLFLPNAKELLTFERLFRRVKQHTGLGWERLAKQEHLNFNWSLSDLDQKWYPEKTRYLHGKVLSVYIAAREKLLAANHPQNGEHLREQINTLFRRFEGVALRYPSSLGAFIWQDLNGLGKVYSVHNQLFQKDFSLDLPTPLTAGDFLLRGLSYLSSHQSFTNNFPEHPKLRRLAFESLNQAILQGASCASHLSIQMLFQQFAFPIWHLQLITSSITKENDYRGLEMILKKDDALAAKLYHEGISYPPILAKLASFQSDEEAEPLLDQAIKGYQDHAPVWVWHEIGRVKHNLKKYKEAAKYFTKACATYGNDVPAILWEDLGCVKTQLSEYEEAEHYLTKAIKAYGSHIPPRTFWAIAISKMGLHDYQEANAYLNKSLTAYGNTVPPEVWGEGAYIKFKLKQNDLAENCLNLALAAYGDHIPIWLLKHTAFIKMRFNKWEEAQENYIKMTAAQMCTCHFSKRFLETIESDFHDILATHKNQVPAWVWFELGLITGSLDKHKEAEEDFTQAILAYGSHVPPYVFWNMSIAKTNQNQWKEAKEFIHQAITTYGEEAPPEVHKCAATIETHLKEER